MNFSSAYERLEGIKSYVLLEVGFDLTKPNEKKTISSWLYDAAIAAGLEVIDNRAMDVRCYLPGYTFVEKLSAISRKYQQEQEGELMPVNFIRHYYDIYQLLGDESVLEFIGTQAYQEHKTLRFRKSDELDLTKNQAFILANVTTREKYTREFKRTEVLYYGGFPTFDQIFERIQSHLGTL